MNSRLLKTIVVLLLAAMGSARAQSPVRTLSGIPQGWTVTANGETVPVINGEAEIPVGATVKVYPPVLVPAPDKAVQSVALVAPNYADTALTLQAITAGTIVVQNPKNSMQYKLNNGEKTALTDNPTTINVSAGDKVQFFGNGTDITSYSGTKITGGTAQVKVYGNIMSLVDETGFATATTLTSEDALAWLFFSNTNIYNHASKPLVLPATTLSAGCYYNMFNGCTGLTMAPALPAETLADNCYKEMFKGCTGLATAPVLQAETLAEGCYSSMFQGCTGLTTAPALPATELASSCYNAMFSGCTHLTTAPELRATTMTASCYQSMFEGCTGLISAPVLPAATLNNYCYRYMFRNCSNLSSVTCFATNISATDCTKDWLSGVAATGTFYKATSMNDWTTNSASGIPVGWTAIPVLSGKFSVSSTDQVYFSQGNLQATYNGSAWNWAFATNQWNCIGNAAGNTSINGNGTVNASNVTVDLFGWVGASNTSWSGELGTNGNAAMHGISKSATYSDYGSGASDVLKSDWCNTIGMGWRTLTGGEWEYIINTRSSGSTVNGTSNARYTLATINTDNGTNGVNGIILFPDGVTIANSEATSWGTINGNSSWGTKCTSAQWNALEAKGCVFLPAAGSRYDATVNNVGGSGLYWSSTASENNGSAPNAYGLNFGVNTPNTVGGGRTFGRAVRLVHTTKSMGSLSHAAPAVLKMIGDAAFTNPLTLMGDGTVSYAVSSGDDICTVNATTGEVTLNGTVGTCTITATVTDGPSYAYAPNTASYTLTVTPMGTLPGKFTINASGDQVHFSMGNLQYQASSDTWRFAEHQYDYVGNADNGTVYEGETKSNNASISSNYSGWIDLFGWGTGDDPTKSTQSNSNYSDFTAWGVNPISNGGNTAYQWRTLTKDEWGYLFNTRANAANLRTLATVNGVTGLIVMPDGWSGDLTITLANYSTNTLSQAQWTSYEAAGCVFLPAAGSRGGTSVGGVGGWGDYWSSSPNGSTIAYYLYFYYNILSPTNNTDRYGGRSVRLVSETPFLGAGTETDPYLISSVADWNHLANKVNSGINYGGKYFRQTANIDVTRMVGVYSNDWKLPFRGTYDGSGYTLNLSINTNSSYAAPFQYIENSTVKNIITTGSVSVQDASSYHPSGLVGSTTGICTIQNCLVGADVSGARHMGGIVGHCWTADISIIGCVYSGTLTPASGQWTGGILGWGGDGGGHTISISDCLFAGSFVSSTSSTKFHPIGILQNQSNTKYLSNTYYTLGAINTTDDDSFVKTLSYKGKFARSITGGTSVTVAKAGTATAVYDVSGITSYGTGILYGGVLYAGNGEEISLTLSHGEAPSGTTFGQYTVTGGGTLDNPTSNSPTLTMTAANQTINAQWITQGALNGKFSVSSTQQVYFSQGNLQATTTDLGANWTWSFATNQWDYIGGRSGGSEPETGNNFINGNGTMSDNGTVDLFGWVGSSNTTWTGAAQYGISNSTHEDEYDYGSSNTDALKSDWGTLAITNGGNTPNSGWRTLTTDEWQYVINSNGEEDKRRVHVGSEYKHPYGQGKVMGKNGLILLPDAWDGSVDDGFSYGTSDWSNVYTEETPVKWSDMEAAGAVFLPAAGRRIGTDYYEVGDDYVAGDYVYEVEYAGNYWSSTTYNSPYQDGHVMFVWFSYLVGTTWSYERYNGSSVRLVKDVE